MTERSVPTPSLPCYQCECVCVCLCDMSQSQTCQAFLVFFLIDHVRGRDKKLQEKCHRRNVVRRIPAFMYSAVHSFDAIFSFSPPFSRFCRVVELLSLILFFSSVSLINIWCTWMWPKIRAHEWCRQPWFMALLCSTNDTRIDLLSRFGEMQFRVCIWPICHLALWMASITSTHILHIVSYRLRVCIYIPFVLHQLRSGRRKCRKEKLIASTNCAISNVNCQRPHIHSFSVIWTNIARLKYGWYLFNV